MLMYIDVQGDALSCTVRGRQRHAGSHDPALAHALPQPVTRPGPALHQLSRQEEVSNHGPHC